MNKFIPAEEWEKKRNEALKKNFSKEIKLLKSKIQDALKDNKWYIEDSMITEGHFAIIKPLMESAGYSVKFKERAILDMSVDVISYKSSTSLSEKAYLVGPCILWKKNEQTTK